MKFNEKVGRGEEKFFLLVFIKSRVLQILGRMKLLVFKYGFEFRQRNEFVFFSYQYISPYCSVGS